MKASRCEICGQACQGAFDLVIGGVKHTLDSYACVLLALAAEGAGGAKRRRKDAARENV